MARPREFDRDVALDKALKLFWAKGFAATSTDELLETMEIGRQSFYNTFGDKRRIYVEALDTYQRKSNAGHVDRLNKPRSPLAGIAALLEGLVPEDDRLRALGCMGVGAVGEFGVTDKELLAQRRKMIPLLGAPLLERIKEGQATGEIDAGMNAAEATDFVQLTMTGLQLAARGGAGAEELRRLARFAIQRLKPH